MRKYWDYCNAPVTGYALNLKEEKKENGVQKRKEP
jgi:hypothetical protein